MKIWHGYGSEHSMNLVMIGHFKSSNDAKKTKGLIDKLTEGLSDKIDVGTSHRRFEDNVMSILKEVNCYMFGPTELEQFLYNINTRVEDDKIILTTDESEVSAFVKLMIENGAKIEVYSAHHYPNIE